MKEVTIMTFLSSPKTLLKCQGKSACVLVLTFGVVICTTSTTSVRTSAANTQCKTNDKTLDLSQVEDICTKEIAGKKFAFYTLLNVNKKNGIFCYDLFKHKEIWHTPSLMNGRFTTFAIDDKMLIECSGFPRENHLAFREALTGKIIGKEWNVANVYSLAISGTNVAVIEGIGPDDQTRVCIYNSKGHLIYLNKALSDAKVQGFERGFVVTQVSNITILSRSGKHIMTLKR